MDQEKYRAPAVDKALDVLEHISQSIDPISFSLLCKELDRSPNELFRVVNCLERRGYLLKDEKANSYSLSFKLYELAHYHPPVQKLLHAASVPMAEFAEMVGLSCHLSVIEKGDMVNLYEQEGANPVLIHVKMGSRFPAILSNSGKYLLALLPQAQLDAFLKHDVTYQNMEATEQKKVLKELTSLRKKEYCLQSSVVIPGVSDALMPVGSAEGGLRATFAVPFFAKLTEKAPLIEAMKQTVQAINQRLGVGGNSPL